MQKIILILLSFYFNYFKSCREHNKEEPRTLIVYPNISRVNNANSIN